MCRSFISAFVSLPARARRNHGVHFKFVRTHFKFRVYFDGGEERLIQASVLQVILCASSNSKLDAVLFSLPQVSSILHIRSRFQI